MVEFTDTIINMPETDRDEREPNARDTPDGGSRASGAAPSAPAPRPEKTEPAGRGPSPIFFWTVRLTPD